MTPDGVYIRVPNSTKAPHWLPHFVPDTLLLQEITYRTYVNGVVTSLHQKKKGHWPPFPLSTKVCKIENFKQAKDEVGILNSFKLKEVYDWIFAYFTVKNCKFLTKHQFNHIYVKNRRIFNQLGEYFFSKKWPKIVNFQNFALKKYSGLKYEEHDSTNERPLFDALEHTTYIKVMTKGNVRLTTLIRGQQCNDKASNDQQWWRVLSISCFNDTNKYLC